MTAENATHLTETLRQSPSLFEVISVKNFGESIPQALEHLALALTRLQPNLTPIARYFDEIYLLFDAAVQYHYIGTKGGTLSEAFYGLERLSGSKRNFKRAYLAAILVPYVRTKISKYFEKLSDESTGENRRINATLLVHYYFTICCDIIKFYYSIMYALGKNTSHSILFSILNLRLSYVTPSLLQNMDVKRVGLRWFLFALGNAILPILELGSFTMQFLQWWQAQDKPISRPLPVPDFYDGQLQLDKSKCPLCFQIRRNNTALSSSGIVFCYTCISKHLKHTRKCPITGVPSRMEHLIRIYDE